MSTLNVDVFNQLENLSEFEFWIMDAVKEFELEDYEILEYEGPAGGNPNVDFYGSRENLLRFFNEWYCQGEPERHDSFEFFMGEED